MLGEYTDQSRTVSPFDGVPTTIDSVEDGVQTITVHASDTEPFRMKVAGAVLFMALAAIFVLYNVLEERIVRQTIFHVVIWGSFACLLVGGALFARQPVTILFTPTHLAVRQGWFGGPWSRFDLAHPHSIGMVPHDKAMREKLSNEYRKESAARSGTAVRTELIYGDTYHICFAYFGQRHDLLTVQGRKEAGRITSRLQACLDINRARAGKGGSATKPAQQWATSSGRVPR